MIAKKPQYIRKYDFIDYFTRPEDEWFYSTDQIMEELTKKIGDSADNEDEEEFDEANNENDTYTSYHQQKDEQFHFKADDPKIIEGILIDQKSKEYLAGLYSKAKAYDFDIVFENNYDFKTQFNKTIEILKTAGDIIIFQPVFIASNKMIAKPDALVRINGVYTIIETKATSKAKAVHILDLFYQKNVLEKVAFETYNFFITDYKLCLIRYCLNKKNTVDFVLSNMVSVAKNGYSVKHDDLVGNKWSKGYVEEIATRKLNSGNCYNINEVFSDSITTKIPSKIAELINECNFDHVIEELISHKIKTDLTFAPTLKYKNEWKDTEYLPTIKQYYATIKDLWMFSYSGVLIDFKNQYQLYENHEVYTESFFNNYKPNSGKKEPNKALKNYLKSFPPFGKATLHNGIFNFNAETINLFKKIKTKKVYFDFETLNLAIRVVDDLPSFVQIVNQVSTIIKSSDTSKEIVRNILLDPKDINKESFKMVIDSILPPDSYEEYSYIVYNKSFEVNRLKEMADYLNDYEYHEKVNVIVANIFDLADFFNLKNSHTYQIVIKELKGYYSIKKVLALIEKDDAEVFDLTKCKNYTTLNVKNGIEAQNLASLRFLNRISDEKWKIFVKNLKEYCENDVRAMIAVYLWISKKIIKFLD